jgi:hypothetical protein
VNAEDLNVDMQLLDKNSKKLAINSIEKNSILVQVYNLTVANGHTYYVSVNEVLVHNANRCKIITAQGFPTKISKQKQNRHIKGTAEWNRKRGGYFLSPNDPDIVLNAVHSGSAKILGKTKNGDLLVEYSGVPAFNNSPGAGFVDQPTTRFFIKKGSNTTSVVPTSPTKLPDRLFDE